MHAFPNLNQVTYMHVHVHMYCMYLPTHVKCRVDYELSLIGSIDIVEP